MSIRINRNTTQVWVWGMMSALISAVLAVRMAGRTSQGSLKPTLSGETVQNFHGVQL